MLSAFYGPMGLNMELESAGARVRHARESRNLTQAQVAEGVGCGVAAIREIEKAEAPRSAFYADVVSFLGETLDWIHCGRGGPVSGVGEGGELPHFDFAGLALRAFEGADASLDALYLPPISMSHLAFTVECPSNARVPWIGSPSVLFVDPLQNLGRKSAVLLASRSKGAAWVDSVQVNQKSGQASIRSGHEFLGFEPCVLCHTLAEYVKSEKRVNPLDGDPVLCLGRVCFLGSLPL